MVCLQAHPLVAPRPALLETLPRGARLTATVELGERLAAEWQAWRGHYVHEWLQTLAATGSDALVGAVHRVDFGAADVAPHRCRSAAALGAVAHWLATGRSAPGRAQVLPDLAHYSAHAREAWRDVVEEGLDALVASDAAAPAARARLQPITRTRASGPEASLWQSWRRELRRWVQGLPSGAPETAES